MRCAEPHICLAYNKSLIQSRIALSRGESRSASLRSLGGATVKPVQHNLTLIKTSYDKFTAISMKKYDACTIDKLKAELIKKMANAKVSGIKKDFDSRYSQRRI
jgi:3-methyladenine DNA glycosylase/8-oxoguanine DNA glycosylase